MAKNPWLVESLNSFLYLKCPECVFETEYENEVKFQCHAIEKHPWSNVLFGDTETVSPKANEKEIFDLISEIGEEIIDEDTLRSIVISKEGVIAYDGFEPSGRMHIAQGVFKAMNVNKCTFPGTNSTFIFWVADWFALMNDKMGGDLDKIKTGFTPRCVRWRCCA